MAGKSLTRVSRLQELEEYFDQLLKEEEELIKKEREDEARREEERSEERKREEERERERALERERAAAREAENAEERLAMNRKIAQLEARQKGDNGNGLGDCFKVVGMTIGAAIAGCISAAGSSRHRERDNHFVAPSRTRSGRAPRGM